MFWYHSLIFSKTYFPFFKLYMQYVRVMFTTTTETEVNKKNVYYNIEL